MRLSEAFNLYREDYIVYNNQSSKTEDTHMRVSRLLLDFLGDIDTSTLTFQQIRDFKKAISKGRDVSTVREYLIRIRVVLKYIKEEGYRTLDYKRITLPERIEKVPEFLTPDQVDQLLRAAFKPVRGYSTVNRYRNRAIISLLFSSGIRSEELRRLNRTDIRPDNTFTVFGKNSKHRLCFIDDRTRQYIDEYLSLRTDNNPALFIADQNGLRLSKHAFQLIFVLLRKKVDFEVPLHGHVLRHSFATDLLRNGANMRYVQVMLGHSSILTTQIYTHVTDPDLQDIHKRFHSSQANQT